MTRFPRFCTQSPQEPERSPDAVPLLVAPTSDQQEAKSSLGFEVGDRVCWIEATGAIYEVIKISGGHATIECIEYRGKSAPPLKRRVPLWQIKTLDVGSDVDQQNAKSSRGLQLGSSEQLELPLNATDRNHEDLCLPTSTSTAGLEVSQEQRNSLGEYKQPDLLRVTPTHSLSCDRIGPTFPSTTTSAPIPLELENLIWSPGDGPATIPAVQAIAPDSTAKSQDFGEKCSESSASQDPGLSLWNSLKDLSLEDFEQCLDHYEWQAINSTIRSSYRLRKQEQCINEIDSLSCPTLTSCSSKTSRPAGMTKCEKWWRDNGLIPSGSQLSTAAIALLLGYPEDWFQSLSPFPPTPQAESAPDTSQGELLHQLRLPWRYAVFSTLIAFWQHEISLVRDSLEGDNKDYSLCNESENASLHLPGLRQRDSEQGNSELEKGSQILQPGMLQFEQAQNQGRSSGDRRGNQEKATLRRNFLGVRELSRQPSHSSESCTCPRCQQLLISLDDGCGTCGWAPSSSVLGDKQNDSSHPLEPEQRQEHLPVLEEKAHTHPLELNLKPVLGDKQTDRTHPLELKEHCDQLLPVLGDSNVEHSTYPLEPKQDQSVLGEMLAEEISSSLNPLILPSVPFSQRKLLPPAPGIYLVLREAKVIYVGQAFDIHKRWRSHILTPKLRTLPDIRVAWKQVLHLPLEPIEKSLIEKFQPLFNTKLVTQPKNPSGWLEHYTKNKQLKSGAIATYPSVEGERDPDNPEHWYWAYRYEEKREGAKSDNGYITRAVSLPRNKVQAVQLAIARGWSVEKIMKFIRNKE